MNKLNLGCGKDIRKDWINVDCMKAPGVDLVWRWGVGDDPNWLAENSIYEVYCSHLIEHIPNPLVAMQELHRVCLNNTKAIFRLPYGSSDNAWEDPTHVRPYFIRSFSYFSQMIYHGADYGYIGDWEVEEVKLIVPVAKHKKDINEMLADINTKRNIVDEMIVTTKCIKPIRRAYKGAPDSQFKLVIEAVE